MRWPGQAISETTEAAGAETARRVNHLADDHEAAAMAHDPEYRHASPLTTVSTLFDNERDRFFLWSPVCFGFGISGYFALYQEPSLMAALAVVAIAVLVFVSTARRSLHRAACLGLCLAAAGFATAKMRVDHVAAPVLQKPIRSADIVGWVTRAESRRPNGQRLTIAVERLTPDLGARQPAYVRVRTLAKNARPAKPGDRVRLTARLSPPSLPALPGGFDFARTAWFESLGGVGYSYKGAEHLGTVAPPDWSWALHFKIQEVRAEIARRVFAAMPAEDAGMAVALMTGERGGISAATSEAYRGSGLFHILSISGLHMVVMAGTVFILVRLLLSAIPALALRVSVKKVAAVIGIITALAYLAISGGAFATVRATVMMVVIFMAVLLDRPALALRNVALSALIILAIFPESLFDAGFQMSFAAVTALVAAYEEVRRRRRNAGPRRNLMTGVAFFGGILFTTLIASAAVAPFAAYHFHQSQQYAVLANLLAVPICNLVVMPSVIAAFLLMPLGLENLALWPLSQGIQAMTWCAEFVSQLPGAVSRVKASSELAFALIVCGGLWVLLWRSPMRLLGFAAILAGFVLVPAPPRPDILIGRNGQLVAMRGDDGRLSALPARQSRFQLGRWLEQDGDARAVKAAQRGNGFRCDDIGCVARVGGVDLVVPRHPAAFVDDCASATGGRPRIVALSVPRPSACQGLAGVIDLFDNWAHGTHAVYVERIIQTTAAEVASIEAVRSSQPSRTMPNKAQVHTRDGAERHSEDRGENIPDEAAGEGVRVRIETVAQYRGQRPWSERPPPLPKARRKAGRTTSPADFDRSKTSINGDRGALPLPRPKLRPADQQPRGAGADPSANAKPRPSDFSRLDDNGSLLPTPHVFTQPGIWSDDELDSEPDPQDID